MAKPVYPQPAKGPPKYPRPSNELIEESLGKAQRFASFAEPRLVVLNPKRIVPREVIVLDDGLTELMRNAPETVPPIVVAPWGDVHVVVDGHHRLAGSLEAELKAIWALEVDLVKLGHLQWPQWY
jgi:hypothetical protein